MSTTRTFPELKSIMQDRELTIAVLADRAGLGPNTVRRARIGEKCRVASLQKIRKALDLEPLFEPATAVRDATRPSVLYPPTVDREQALANVKRKFCGDSPAACSGCHRKLIGLQNKGEVVDVPENRALCRVAHGWKVEGGELVEDVEA